jgi:nucleotide-binding universal stress UspA family protein
MYVPDIPAADVAKVKDAERRLERQCAALAERGITATAAVSVGTVARAVKEYAAEIGADLVIMSTHGRTGMAHLTMGSVAEEVVRTASCPVLTIRPVPGTLSRRSAA